MFKVIFFNSLESFADGCTLVDVAYIKRWDKVRSGDHYYSLLVSFTGLAKGGHYYDIFLNSLKIFILGVCGANFIKMASD